jgi:hypothetical protein
VGYCFATRTRSQRSTQTTLDSMDVEGVDHYISAWVKESKHGKKFYRLSIKPKNDVAAPAIQRAKQIVEEDFEDDIPF